MERTVEMYHLSFPDGDLMPYFTVSSILAEGTIHSTFFSEEELADALDQYTGADGEYTPLVKCVTLYQNNPDLEGISIVDTPGLNDSVRSRTQRTRDFLASCDVVFFLSPASQFLDAGDVDLLQNQLPSKGVVRLRLIVSHFDDVLMDAIYDADSLAEVVRDTKQDLSPIENELTSCIAEKDATLHEKNRGLRPTLKGCPA